MYKIRVEALLLRNPHLVITNAKDLVSAYHKYSNNDSMTYSFCIVEVMEPFERQKKDERAFIRIPNIMKCHEIHYFEGGLIAKEVPCFQCARLDALCPDCRLNFKYTVKPDKVARALSGWKDPESIIEEEVVLDVEGMADQEEVLEQSDFDGEDDLVEDDGGVEDEGVTLFPVGKLVWGLRYGVRQPAQVISLEDVPEGRRKSLRTKKGGSVILKFIGKEKYGIAETTKLVELGDNEQDHSWGMDNIDYLRALRML